MLVSSLNSKDDWRIEACSKDFFRAIRKMRLNMGISLRKIAEDHDMTLMRVVEMERGDSIPRLHEIYKFMDAVGVKHDLLADLVVMQQNSDHK